MKTVVTYAAAVLLMTGCSLFKSTPEVAPKELVIAYQSNRTGEVEPCGCQVNPFGGIDREANAIQGARKNHPELLYVDAGNLFIPVTPKISVKHYQAKSKMITDALNRIGLDAFSPGPNDYQLGLKHLQSLTTQSKFKYVSTNVVSAEGTPIFAPYVILNREGVRVAILSATPAFKTKEAIKVESAEESLKKLLPTIRPQADLIVLLSQLGTSEDERLAKTLDLNIIVGADAEVTMERAAWSQGGKTLLVDAGISGRHLGLLSVGFTAPFKGFYSMEEISNNQEELRLTEASIAKNPSNEMLKQSLAALKSQAMLEPIEGGSRYSNELIKLDAENYGTPNEISLLISQEKAKVRKRAIGD